MKIEPWETCVLCWRPEGELQPCPRRAVWAGLCWYHLATSTKVERRATRQLYNRRWREIFADVPWDWAKQQAAERR